MGGKKEDFEQQAPLQQAGWQKGLTDCSSASSSCQFLLHTVPVAQICVVESTNQTLQWYKNGENEKETE